MIFLCLLGLFVANHLYGADRTFQWFSLSKLVHPDIY